MAISARLDLKVDVHDRSHTTVPPKLVASIRLRNIASDDHRLRLCNNFER